MDDGAVATGAEEGKEEAEKQEEVARSLREHKGSSQLPLFVEIAGLKNPVSGIPKNAWEGGRMNRFLIIAAVLVAGLMPGMDPKPALPGMLASSGIACAQENWKTEFDDVCSQTQDAMALSAEELKRLVARCDAIKLQIEELPDESQKKVTLKRLQMCRDLFDFVLQDKESRK
jgi:hypothetical protein